MPPTVTSAPRVNPTATTSTGAVNGHSASRFTVAQQQPRSAIASLGHRERAPTTLLSQRQVAAAPAKPSLPFVARALAALRNSALGKMVTGYLANRRDDAHFQDTKLPEVTTRALEEPSLQELSAARKQELLLDKESLAPIANRLEFLLHDRAIIDKHRGVNRIDDPESFKKLDEIDAEINKLAATVGERLSSALPLDTPDAQNRYAATSGFDVKGKIWGLMKEANPNLPDWKPVDLEGFEYDTSKPKDFLDQAYLSAGKNPNVGFGPWNGSVETPPNLTLNGVSFSMVKKLGQGGGGVVFLYESDVKPAQQVAIKLPLATTAISRRDAHREAETHLLAMGEHMAGHEHVVGLKGVCLLSPDTPVVILECASKGDLRKLTGEDMASREAEPAATATPGMDASGRGQKLGAIDRAESLGLISPKAGNLVKLLLLRDSLKGASFLQETRGVIHGDLKPENIFLAADGKTKIADFGTGAIGDSDAMGVGRTEAYVPVENKTGSEHRARKMDTWALGVFAHELFNKGQRPSISYATKQLERDSWGEKLDSNARGVGKLINSMLDPDPELRPTLSAALKASCFDELNAGGEQLTSDVRALVIALTEQPTNPAKLQELSAKLDA